MHAVLTESLLLQLKACKKKIQCISEMVEEINNNFENKFWKFWNKNMYTAVTLIIILISLKLLAKKIVNFSW